MSNATQTPGWTPDADTVARSNLVSLMHKTGIDSYGDLHRWSVESPARFWGHVVDDLAISFEQPPSATLGNNDPRKPEWLVDARFNIVASCLDGNPSAPAIVYGDRGDIRSVTTGELRTLVARFANGFAEAGFREGDRVAIAMPMTVDAVVAYLGIVAAGGVVVSIADSFAPDEIALRLNLTSPVAVVTQDRMTRTGRSFPMYDKCVEASDAPCIVVDTGENLSLRAVDVWWDDFCSTETEFQPVAGEAGTHTNILFSSGTTGEPKAIPWTQTTPIKAAMDGRFHQDIHRGDVVAWPTNLGWMMGPWLIYASLLNGAAMALYDDAPTGRGFVEFVRDAGVTMLGLVPSIVAAWRGSDDLKAGDWKQVRVLSSTGEASNPDDYAWLMHAAGHLPVIEYCGGTEIGGGYLTSTVLEPAAPSRFTTPALGLDLVLLDDSGDVADIGEVFLFGTSMGLSTELLNRDHTEVYFSGVPSHPQGLRRHGDQLERSGDGTYRALGRVDDTMNLGGIKVSSAELEEVLGTAVGVVEVAAVAVPPEDGGPDRLVVFAVLEPGASGDALVSAMQALVKEHLNPLFRIHDVVVVDALPRTASQKVMRRVLRTDYS
ncbi:MAG: AMP-binding protein [Acidimicrobiia bacterium]